MTGRSSPVGPAISWSYEKWVCAETIAATRSSTPAAIFAKVLDPVASAMLLDAAPSCTRSTSTSASPLSGSPSVSCPAYRLTWLTTGAISSPSTPPGLTSPG